MTNSNSLPNITRKALLDELAGLTSIERGTLFEEYRSKPGADGSPTKLGPYFKHQCWAQRKNRSVRVSAVEVPALRQDLQNGKRFIEITNALADMAMAESRAKRKALTPAAAEGSARDLVSKKNSRSNVSKKGIAKPNRSSPASKSKSAKTASAQSSKS